MRAAEAHNLTALIMSDCGLPALARTLCWRQFELFRTSRSCNAATAKLALQPLVNLGRLLIRDGDGTAAYRLLEALFEAVKAQSDTVIDGRKISFGDFISHDDDHREVVQWLWTVLLSDGTRALTRAGQWAEALQNVQQHKGIGHRLLDGRQVAILAHCAGRDYDTASAMLADTATSAVWEEAVAACLRVLCLGLADRPADSDVTTMVDRYLALEREREHAIFRVRLGLCIIDLSTGTRGIPQVASAIVRDALETTDAYAAYDALSHETCLSRMTEDGSRALTEIVRASGLERGTIPAEILDDLMESVRISEASIADALDAHAYEHGVTTGQPLSNTLSRSRIASGP
ncbi:hypothetical protein [Frankia sp. Cj3]|uniref:hypothetical protein n=1 Tax=Frankia sp. Cj3 TaxID=2880976 RepID=UPI001EF70E20|nr:hypothetical protein [Frankia sp. Cj3]